MSEIIKTCKKHGLLPTDKVLRWKAWEKDYKSGKYYYVNKSRCKYCINEMAREQRKKHGERLRAYERKWYQENREHINLLKSIARKKPDRLNQERLKDKKQTEKLCNSYIKQVLALNFNCKPSEVPIDLINIKRANLILKREIKKHKK